MSTNKSPKVVATKLHVIDAGYAKAAAEEDRKIMLSQEAAKALVEKLLKEKDLNNDRNEVKI